MMLMIRFCKFQKQNRELSYAKSVGQAGHVKRKLVDGLVPVSGRNLFVMVNSVKDESRFSKRCGIYSSGNKFYKADWVFLKGMKPNSFIALAFLHIAYEKERIAVCLLPISYKSYSLTLLPYVPI